MQYFKKLIYSSFAFLKSVLTFVNVPMRRIQGLEKYNNDASRHS